MRLFTALGSLSLYCIALHMGQWWKQKKRHYWVQPSWIMTSSGHRWILKRVVGLIAYAFQAAAYSLPLPIWLLLRDQRALEGRWWLVWKLMHLQRASFSATVPSFRNWHFVMSEISGAHEARGGFCHCTADLSTGYNLAGQSQTRPLAPSVWVREKAPHETLLWGVLPLCAASELAPRSEQ